MTLKKSEMWALDLQAKKAAEARSKFLNFVMQEENCSLDYAHALCLGCTDPIVYEYTLGWKLSDPLTQHGMWARTSSAEIRAKFVRHFREGLTPEEDTLFDEYYLKNNMAERKYQRKLKKKKKKTEVEK